MNDNNQASIEELHTMYANFFNNAQRDVLLIKHAEYLMFAKSARKAGFSAIADWFEDLAGKLVNTENSHGQSRS
jgi:rubrerythrin